MSALFELLSTFVNPSTLSILKITWKFGHNEESATPVVYYKIKKLIENVKIRYILSVSLWCFDDYWWICERIITRLSSKRGPDGVRTHEILIEILPIYAVLSFEERLYTGSLAYICMGIRMSDSWNLCWKWTFQF